MTDPRAGRPAVTAHCSTCTCEPARYEWGIVHLRTGEIHRSRMTQAQARMWLADWDADGGKADVFALLSRPLGDWQTVPR